jgi:hypothetical protein
MVTSNKQGATMIQSLSLSGLEDLAAGDYSPRRDAILSTLTDQYLELEPRLSDRHIELYDNVFQLLVTGIELHARLALAEKLAPMKRAPREIVRDLANDDYAIVASPILRHSPLLDEADLVGIATRKSEAHRAALAQRPNLNTAVTDVLVNKREQSVLVALIGNDTAKLSSAGATTLTDIASQNAVVAQSLASRLQLPATAVTQILIAARAVVVSTLSHAEPDARASEITGAVRRGVEAVGALPETMSDDVNEQQIVTLYGLGQIEDVVLGLARRAELDPAIVRRALEVPCTDALLIVMKAAGFERQHAQGILSVKMSVALNSPALLEPLGQYDRINAADPARMLVFVLSRHVTAVAH